MSILKVARMGHPVLRAPARPLDKSMLRDPLVQKLMDDMIETMHEYHGVGLAAPQVHEDLRIFVALLEEDPGPDTEAMVIVNPELAPRGPVTEEGWEGCLSIPDIRGMVPRFVDIVLKAQDRHGKPIELNLRKFPARVVQHEADHLDGVLFFDRMASFQTLTFMDEYSRYHTKDED
jgi:peptide deformylase